MSQVDLMIKQAVERRLGRNRFSKAVELAAESLGMGVGRVERAWAEATTPDQERVLDFLSHDHGHFRLASPAPRNPLIGWLDVGVGDLEALFDDHHVWLIYRDGDYAFVGLHSPTSYGPHPLPSD